MKPPCRLRKGSSGLVSPHWFKSLLLDTLYRSLVGFFGVGLGQKGSRNVRKHVES